MKKIFSILLLTFSLTVTDLMAASVDGMWFFYKIETKGSVDEPLVETEFTKDGLIRMMSMDFGTYKHNKSKNTLVISSKKKSFAGTYNITFSNKKMILKNKKSTLYFEEYNLQKISDDNKLSKLVGTWNKQDKKGTYTYKFTLPNLYTCVYNGMEMSETTKGDWIFNPQEKTLTVLSMSNPLRGKSILKSVSKSEFVILTQEGEVSATKQVEFKIEKLNFTYEDLPEEPTYEFPQEWNIYSMQLFLSTLKSVDYKVTKSYSEVMVHTHIRSQLEVNRDKNKITILNFKLVDGKIAEQFSKKIKDDRFNNANNDFFPEEELYPFRRLASQKVTVAAGIFQCSVYEGMNGEDKIKLWMIEDMPGIYAKVISQKTGPYGEMEYTVRELEKIHKR